MQQLYSKDDHKVFNRSIEVKGRILATIYYPSLTTLEKVLPSGMV